MNDKNYTSALKAAVEADLKAFDPDKVEQHFVLEYCAIMTFYSDFIMLRELYLRLETKHLALQEQFRMTAEALRVTKKFAGLEHDAKANEVDVSSNR